MRIYIIGNDGIMRSDVVVICCTIVGVTHICTAVRSISE
jgi:hypothetical protein